jgi:hypothetical protein
MRISLPYTLLTVLSGAACVTLAAHYPLAPIVITIAALAGMTAFGALPNLWLLLLPALLPVIGLAPWTGWITFEELDILILAAAAGGYARLTWAAGDRSTSAQRTPRLSLTGWLLTGLFGVATAISIYRGFADAGGFRFGWYQGYHEPMNSVRVGKSFFLALLLLPLWQTAYKTNRELSQRLLSLGLILGLAATALTTIWERAAFTGLLNFSADYRTTGMFWEMHVGGAALDGFLALTVPFAVRELLVARSTLHWSLAASVLSLSAYACLTTFSRGVYLALPTGMLVLYGLTARLGWQGVARDDDVGWQWRPLLTGAVLVAGFAGGSAWMFQSSGYRGMAALLGSVALMLPLVQVLRGMKASRWFAGLAFGFVLMTGSIAIAWLVPKGAYIAWGLAAGVTMTVLSLCRRTQLTDSFTAAMAAGGFLATLAGVGLVASHWGGYTGFRHATPVLLALLVVCIAAGVWQKPLWPESLRWQATAICSMGLVAAVIGVMGGGAYMSDRFSTGGKDWDSRLAHWKLGRDMLQTPADWWLGKGTGRFPANYFLNGNPGQHPGDYRLGSEGSGRFLTVTGGLPVGGEWLRLSQRVAAPGKQAEVTLRVRSANSVTLQLEVCEKHLLYSSGCLRGKADIKGFPGVWQNLTTTLSGPGATHGEWYAPRLLIFSVAMGTRGGKADIDNLTLTAADGRQLLANGDFSGSMAHWFSSSDRSHLPWHIKSLLMNELFDQGVIGLGLWLMLYLGAIWRLSFGEARMHPLGPAMSASLVGFAVVGLFDSLLDVPRLAWLYYFLMLVALTLPAVKPQRGAQ